MTTRGVPAHDEVRELLEAAALDALEPAEQLAVLEHVRSCAECQAELASLRETVGALAHASQGPVLSKDRSDAVRARLLERAGRKVEPLPSRQGPLLPWALAAGIGFLLAVGGLVASLRQRAALREALKVQTQRAAESVAQTDSLRRLLDERSRLIAALTGPDVAVVEMTAAGTRAASARMFWDRATHNWSFVAHNMPRLAAGRTYQLWLVTRGAQKISAGTFEPTATGDALVRANYELPRNALAAVAVTEEPAGGVPQPTGAIVISGAPGALR
jgi:hypothetical protein